MQNVAKEPGIRELYVASPGYALLSVDFNQQELGALAQHCYTRYGFSVLKDVINAGFDVHAWAGTKIEGYFNHLPPLDVNNKELCEAYKEIINNFKEVDADKFSATRSMAKPCNFGQENLVINGFNSIVYL